MLKAARDRFNAGYSDARHQAFVQAVTAGAGVPIEFRLSETPCFFPADLMQSLIEAAQAMTDQLLNNAAYRTAARTLSH
jgi:hypothetical protein